ncbi:MAG: class I SAM-dependent rRNA methyltransferase [Phycisphaerales bacterium]|nr:class I SAM-dependent rRNA methyltransferase [Phycisphaerales bacterium]
MRPRRRGDRGAAHRPAQGRTGSGPAERKSPRQANRAGGSANRRPATAAGGSISDRLKTAFERRRPLLADGRTDAVRLFHGAADGIDGLVIEKLAEVLIVQMHEGRLAVSESALREGCESLRTRAAATAVYRKVYPRTRGGEDARLAALHREATPWIGTPAAAELIAREGAARFAIRPYDGFSTGLFLEQRDNRALVRDCARGLRVLNTFAYTCGFTVLAALGGAVETVSVDASRRYLSWGQRNFEINELSRDGHRFLTADVGDYLRRAVRRGERFDLVILDPPTFGRGPDGEAFSFADHAPRLVADAIHVLAEGGRLLFATNHRGTPAAALRRMIEQAARSTGRRPAGIDAPPLPPDFAGDEAYAATVTARID